MSSLEEKVGECGFSFQRQDESLVWSVLPSKMPTTFFDESVSLAKRIHETHGHKGIWIPLSGGIDSECVAKAFCAAKVPFTAAIMSFNGGLNEHDIKYALRFCHLHSLPFKIFELDVRDFFQSGAHLCLAKEFGCTSPQIACHLWLAQQINGYSVFAGCPLRFHLPYDFSGTRGELLSRVADSPQFLDAPNENQLALKKQLDCTEHGGEPSFFTGNANIIVSALASRHPMDLLLERLWDDFQYKQKSDEHGFYRSRYLDWLDKYRLFIKNGFDIYPRPSKYTGFEVLHRDFGEDEFSGLLNFNEKYRQPMQEIASLPGNQFVKMGRDNMRLIEKVIGKREH